MIRFARMLAGDHMLSRDVIRSNDIQPPHLVLQSSALKAKALCCSATAGYSPGSDSQSIEDRLALRLFECGGRCNNTAYSRFP